ncbi:Dicer-like protein 1 [Mortierella sp. AM989]|nr:Dicer-like protein 1 [Mortierella sp. AM989]
MATSHIHQEYINRNNTPMTEAMQWQLGLQFISLRKLNLALTPSTNQEGSSSWSVLGESFLKFFLASYSFARYQDSREGELTKFTQRTSQISVIAGHFRSSGLVNYIVGNNNQTRCSDRVAALIFRKIIGAAIVDGGIYDAVRAIRSMGMITDAATIAFGGIQPLFKLYAPVKVPLLPLASIPPLPSTLDSIASFRVRKVERALGYIFKSSQLLTQTLTHSTAEKLETYQRLEFLGDAVLEYVVAEHYYQKTPDTPAKKFKTFKSLILCNDALGSLFASLGLNKMLVIEKESTRIGLNREAAKVVSQRENGLTSWRGTHLNKSLGDTMEAMIGAVFVDSGFVDSGFDLQPVREVLRRTLVPFVDGSNLDCTIEVQVTKSSLKRKRK